ncbi:MAG: DPP IV N-terminal domain-containing protein [Deltaproteobacteria bacterium]|nr:DPP IV N-terminal domain-containing protein [Deltaproteobacteria bacterium]
MVHPYNPVPSISKASSEIDPEIRRIFNKRYAYKDEISLVNWSEDGKIMIYAKRDKDTPEIKKLWLFNTENNREIKLALGKDETPVQTVFGDNNSVVIVTDKSLYKADINGDIKQIILDENGEDLPFHIEISDDKKMIAYSAKGNLYIYNFEKETREQLTGIAEKGLCAGCVPWLYSEEFNTKNGFGWSADNESIWFFLTDERDVKDRFAETDNLSLPEPRKYSMAGENNPIVDVGVINITSPSSEPVWMNLESEKDNYLPDCEWLKDGTSLIVSRLDRLQTKIEILKCDSKTGECNTFLSRSDPRWVNYKGLPLFSNNGDDFLYIDDQSGFPHIYHSSFSDSNPKMVTSGNWSVKNIEGFNPESKIIYFSANRQDAARINIYSINTENGKIKKVGSESMNHKPDFNSSLSFYTDFESSMNRSPSFSIYNMDGEKISTLLKGDEYITPKDVVNEILKISFDNETFYAHVTRPRTMADGVKFPVLVYVYGGPQYQAVTDSFNNAFSPWRNVLAERGIVVLTIDNRGSSGRGRDFELPAYMNLTKNALEDQKVLLSKFFELGYGDKKRTGIFGWSFGGTMALLAALDDSNMYKAAVSVAPVTDWRYYDTAYTERYMKRPDDNKKGYEESSILNRAGKLKIPLLLIHGLGDTNVLPINSQLLLNRFIESGKTPQTLFYPSRNHSIKGAETRTHLFSVITRFFEANL